MTLNRRFAPRVSGMLVIGLLALLVVPSLVPTTALTAWGVPNDEAPAAPAQKSEPATSSEFPYVLKFEPGATKFMAGDKITILEVRGTADTFSPGNIYWIKGTYTLASRERAGLSAYITAMDAKDENGASMKVQSVRVDQGSGTFTLFLPMSYRGWPHVSFYPVGNGEGFGDAFFGTGDTVLKKLW